MLQLPCWILKTDQEIGEKVSERWFSSRSSLQSGIKVICDWYIITAQTCYVFCSISIETRSRKTYQMTQRSPKSGKGLQKEIHLGESVELSATSWRFSLLSDTKILHNWNITMIYARYCSKCISIESMTYENIEKDPKITNICQGVAERGPSLWIVEAGGHLGRHLGFWKMLKGELNSPGKFCLCDVWSCRIKWEKNYISQVRVCSPGCLTINYYAD